MTTATIFERAVLIGTDVDRAERFTIHKGEMVGLVGENGSGKTIVGKGVAGIIRFPGVYLYSSDGAATLLDPLPAWRRSMLGMLFVPSDEPVFTELTVAENLEVARVPTRSSRRRYHAVRVQALDTFEGLLPPLHRRADGLSGGERRFVALTRAWLTFALMESNGIRFPLLIVDEPTAGVYVAAIPKIAFALRQLTQQGVAVMVIEQTGTPLRDHFDRSYTIVAGQIAANELARGAG